MLLMLLRLLYGQLYEKILQDLMMDYKDPTCIEELSIDELKASAWDKCLDANNRLLIRGLLAGSGKTTNIVYYCQRSKKKCIIITPYNELAQDHMFTFKVDACTVDHFFGIGFNSDSSSKSLVNGRVDYMQYNVIIFDEIYAYTTDRLNLVRKFLEKEDIDNKQVYANGDIYQNKPIENLQVAPGPYYNGIINSLFPTQLLLKKSRRLVNPKDEERMFGMLKFIFDKFEVIPRDAFITQLVEKFQLKTVENSGIIPGAVNQCYTNASCHRLCKLYNDNEATGKVVIEGNYNWFKGMEVINKTRFVIGSDAYHINTRYTINKISKEKVKLISRFNDKCVIPYDTFNKNFLPTHAFTGHGIQGKTFDTKMIIHDLKHPWITPEWLYTAVSRARKIDDVILNVSNINDDDLSTYNFEAMVDSYIFADTQAHRKIEDMVDRDWIISTTKVQGGCCYHCNCSLNVFWKHGDALNISVDRINNDEAHNKDNCVISCVRCNVTKK